MDVIVCRFFSGYDDLWLGQDSEEIAIVCI